MAREPLPLGSWGRIGVTPRRTNAKGKVTSYRARATYRGFDGVSRLVETEGRTKSAAEARLLKRLREGRPAAASGGMRPTDRFSVAAELWFERIEEMVSDGRRSPGTAETYRRQLDNHVLPALRQVRLGEITAPLVDRVLRSLKTHGSPATAKSCRTVISGVLSVAVRHGALVTNPVRDAEPIETMPKRPPRALDAEERREWFAMLAADPKALAADLPDLTTFLLGTGARIGEALGILWQDIDLDAGEVDIHHQVVRVTGEGLVRTRTKSRAGERVLRLPSWCVAMLQARAEQGIRPDEPVFCDVLGGFRDPNNVRRDLRSARAPRATGARRELGTALRAARRGTGLSRDGAAEALGWPRTRLELLEVGRAKVEPGHVAALAEAYRLTGAQRTGLDSLAELAAEAADGDALAWITSHSFRKTTATILDDAGRSAREIADQLGHARPSITQDVYMGRRSRNPGAARALEGALDEGEPPKMGG